MTNNVFGGTLNPTLLNSRYVCLYVLTDDCRNIAAILRAVAERQYVFNITKELQHWVICCDWYEDDVATLVNPVPVEAHSP